MMMSHTLNSVTMKSIAITVLIITICVTYSSSTESGDDTSKNEDNFFVMDVMDAHASPKTSHHSSSPSFQEPSSVKLRKDCILRVTPTFSSVDQVWSLISRLMPPKVSGTFLTDNGNSWTDMKKKFTLPTGKHVMSKRPDLQEESSSSEDVENPSSVIESWLSRFFTVNAYSDEDGVFRYHVTIHQQNCNVLLDEPGNKDGHKTERLDSSFEEVIPSSDDFESKLKEMGIEYHLIRIIRSPSSESTSTRSNSHSKGKHKHSMKQDMHKNRDEEEEEDDYFNEIIAPSILDHHHRGLHDRHENEGHFSLHDERDWEVEYEKAGLGRHRRHNRRHALRATPYESESWLNPSMTTVTVLGSTDLSSVNPSLESTISQPSLTLPTTALPIPAASSSVLDTYSSSPPVISPSLTTPTLVAENGMISTTLLPDNILRHHHNVHDNNNLHNDNRRRPVWNNLYTTPGLHPEVPTSSIIVPSFSLPLPTVDSISTTTTSDVFTRWTSSSIAIDSSSSLSTETVSETSMTSVIASSSEISVSSSVPSSSIVTSSSSSPVSEVTDETNNIPSTTSSSETNSSSSVSTTTTSPSSSTESNEDKDSDNDIEGKEDESSRSSTRPPPGVWIPANHAPMVKRRIQKLSIFAGTWFKFSIPEDTFWDEEDGGTRNLKLGFYLPEEDSRDSVGSRGTPSADSWIQFDVENQFLYALPTDKSIGKHTFILLAVDSSGSVAEEALQINVRQHKGTRRFNHEFFLYDVAWDSSKFPVLIQATEKLLSRISHQLYGDSSLDAINVLRIEPEEQVRKGREPMYTISWTNESLPAFPCPRDQIDSLYEKLGDPDRPLSSSSSSSFLSSLNSPSRFLNKVLSSSEFKVSSVGVSLTASCEEKGPSPAVAAGSGAPQVRNQLDLLQIPIGHVYRFRIPRDMFYSPKGGQSVELDLDLLTIEGKVLPNDGFVYFNGMTQEIYALGLGNPLRDTNLQQQEYMLVARDMETSQTAMESFVIEFVSSEARDRNAFEITMTLTPNTENDVMTIENKIHLMYRIATHVFSDSDPSAMKVVSFKKGKYAPQYQIGSHSNRKRRREVNMNQLNNNDDMNSQHHSHPHQTYASYYEIVWTNKTLLLDPIASNCPTNVINDNILNRLFSSRHDVESISRHFDPEYRLLHVAFRPMGGCSTALQSIQLGEQPVAVIDLDHNTTRTTVSGTVNGQPVSERTPSEEEKEAAEEIDILMTSIVPAVAILVVLLSVTCVIVCCLASCRRRAAEKSHFEVIAGRSGYNLSGMGDYGVSHYGMTERDAFLVKGRPANVFEQEMQPQTGHLITAGGDPYGFYAPRVIAPPGQSPLLMSHTTSNLQHSLQQQQSHNNSPGHGNIAPQSLSHHYNLNQLQTQQSLSQQHPLLRPTQQTPPTPHHAMNQVSLAN